MREDGTVHPAVEAFRKYKHTELGYLTAIAEMRHAEHEESRDLVAEMARVDEVEPVQEAGESEGKALACPSGENSEPSVKFRSHLPTPSR